MNAVLVRNWWAFVIRGVLGIVFGLIALFMPGITMLSLVLVFAAYAMADGVFAIVGAVRAAKRQERWGPLAFEGIIDIVAGAAAVLLPSLTVVVFVALVACWAVISGGLMLAGGLKLDSDHGRTWLILGGVASLIYGALLIIAPMVGALVLTWWIGAYAIVFGVALLSFAFKLRARAKALPLGVRI